MNFGVLLVLYLLLGAVCAVAILRRTWPRPGRRGFAEAALAIPLWPLWAPVALAEGEGRFPSTGRPTAGRIDIALREGVEAARGTPLEAMLNAASAARIGAMAARAEARVDELGRLLARPELCPAAARARLEAAERAGPPRALATARLQLENLERLQAMASRDAEVLGELAALAEALRTQLLMARYAGSSGQGIGDIVSDLWSAAEALYEAMESEPARAHPGGHDGVASHLGRG